MQPMAEEFLPDPDPVNPFAQPSPPLPSRPGREPVKVMLIGSRQGVINQIHTLYIRGYAQVGEWSPIQPMPNGEGFMSLLIKYIALE